MASSNTRLLDGAYSYKGKFKEFSIPKKAKNNLAFQKNVINAFFEVPTCPYTEFPLSMFAEWYHELPFVRHLVETHATVGSKEFFQFSVIFLRPEVAATTSEVQGNFQWAQDMVIAFFCSIFAGDDAHACIAMSLLSSFTIMIVGRNVKKKSGMRSASGVFSQTISGNDDVFVVAAVTYRNGSDLECGSSLVVYMAVSHVLDNLPSSLVSWKYIGFGRLLLIMVIKLSTIVSASRQGIPEVDEPLPGIDIYAQLMFDSASGFFERCGFVRINDITSSAFA